MIGDARFEDGADNALYLRAYDPEGLAVVSALAQDAVLLPADLKWGKPGRRLDLLVNRFRWEDRAAAQKAGRPYERVRSVLTLLSVEAVASHGFERGADAPPLTLLSLLWEPRAPGPGPEPDGGNDSVAADAGRIVLNFAGGGMIRVEVECIDAALRDVTRPYLAPSGKAPDHGPEDATGR